MNEELISVLETLEVQYKEFKAISEDSKKTYDKANSILISMTKAGENADDALIGVCIQSQNDYNDYKTKTRLIVESILKIAKVVGDEYESKYDFFKMMSF